MTSSEEDGDAMGDFLDDLSGSSDDGGEGGDKGGMDLGISIKEDETLANLPPGASDFYLYVLHHLRHKYPKAMRGTGAEAPARAISRSSRRWTRCRASWTCCSSTARCCRRS